MKAFLHIGVGKTGTSTIQKFFAENRPALRLQGFYYPACLRRGRSGRQIKLAAYALREDRFTDPRMILKLTPENLEDFRLRLEGEFADELSSMPSETHTVILSDEGLSALKEKAEIEKIRDFLAPHFDEIEIIVYLRRQDQHSLSHHSQLIKAGRVLNQRFRDAIFYRYDEYIGLWSSVFGKENISPRIFERSRLPEGNVVYDILQACGVDHTDKFQDVGYLNESLTGEAEAFLKHINRHFEAFPEGNLNQARTELLRILLQDFVGKPPLPARDRALAFLKRYEESNERTRARWFPDQASLFSDDFSKYPEEEPDIDEDMEAMMRVAAQVLQRMSAEVSTLNKENLSLKAKLKQRDS